MNIRGYIFTDPWRITAAGSIERAVVYVVMTKDVFTPLSYLYVGQTKNLAERFDQHEKWQCWLRNQKSGGLFVSFLRESDENKRFKIETELRNNLLGLTCNKQ